MINYLYIFGSEEKIDNNKSNNTNIITIRQLFKDLKNQFTDKIIRKEKMKRIYEYIHQDILYLKFICLQNALQNIQNYDKRKKLINSLNIEENLKNTNLTLTPILDMNLRIQITSKNKIDLEEIESEKLLKEINKAVNYIISTHKNMDVDKLNKAEKIFFDFEESIIKYKERKKILDDLDSKLQRLEKELCFEANNIIDRLFKNESLQEQLIFSLEKTQDIAPYEELELFFIVRCQLMLIPEHKK